MNTAPSVMISSTFYDLRQIRIDLCNFISNDLGYNTLLSELPSFPVDPDVNTIENCRLRVEQHADIMVLIIGGRYGSIDTKSVKSITNLEFLAAKAKGIPVYAFINKSVLANMPIWKANPGIDFSSVVDTPKLFEFIELVRSKEQVWTFEFESAQDIINSLRSQLAYLFYDSLNTKKMINDSHMPPFMEELRPKTLRIALEKPPAWEYKLFFQSWIDEIDCRADMIREYKTGLQIGEARSVTKDNASNWLQTQLEELRNLIDSASVLINESAQEALGEPGEPSNVEQIIWITRMIGRVLEQVIQWANKMRCTLFEPPYDSLPQEAALFIDDIVNQFETYPRKSLQAIENALATSDGSSIHHLELKITLELSNQDQFNKKLDEIKKHNK